MVFRLLREMVWHRKGHVGLILLAIMVGVSLSTALLSISINILGKMERELRSYGANIAVTPKSEQLEIDVAGVVFSPSGASYVDERELGALKTIFWGNNILGFVPFLSTPVRPGDGKVPAALTGTWFDKKVNLPPGSTIGSLTTGVKTVYPFWQVTGTFPDDSDKADVLLGVSLARRLNAKIGDVLPVEYGDKKYSVNVVGLVNTGSFEDDQIIGNLAFVQKLNGLSYGASRVMVSAMVEPEEKLAPEIRNKRPEDMTPEEYEIWYCSPVIESVSRQIEEAISGSQANPIRQVAVAEGAFLVKMEGLIVLITVFALAISILGVMATLNSAIFERRGEIGLMKALGAQKIQIATLFAFEAAVLGIAGGVMGYFGGAFLAGLIGEQVFSSTIVSDSSFLPLAISLALGIALLGSLVPVWQATKIAPVKLMKG